MANTTTPPERGCPLGVIVHGTVTAREQSGGMAGPPRPWRYFIPESLHTQVGAG